MLNFDAVLDDVTAKAKGLAGTHRELGFSRTDVSLAFQAVYYASIRREEGEVVRPHLVLLSEENFISLGVHTALLIADEPRSLAPELLRVKGRPIFPMMVVQISPPG